ncbi:MAG: PD-(D/E)XK nuclease family protein, partial [Clostridia bacterium]|nr:PD-(D/E)XK nuclease family protein [Clostridia bacterium]
IKSQLERFIDAGLMSELQRGLLSVERLENILKMPAFEGLDSGAVYREREFVCRLPSADYLAVKGGGVSVTFSGDDGNGVIVQGAIDLLHIVRENGKLVSAHIIDYKYTSHGDGYLKHKYLPQLALYRSVVCKIYGLDESAVSGTIVNIHDCRQIELF